MIFKTLDNFLLSIEILGWACIIGALLLLIADKLPYNNKTILDLSFKEVEPIYDVDYDQGPGVGAVGY